MTYFTSKLWNTGAFLLLSLAACQGPLVTSADGGDGRDGAPDDAFVGTDGAMSDAFLPDVPVAPTPAILSNAPLGGATDVAINGNARVTFSEPMDRSTVTTDTFVLTVGDSTVRVPGTVIYAGTTAVFWPAAALEVDTMYTATVTTEAMSALGAPIEEDYVWSFTTGNTREPGIGVNLGAANDFVILAKSGISTVPTSDVIGDIAVSPAAASFITGFSLIADPTNVFSTSPQVTGRVYAADYAAPTPANLTTSIGDMELAFVDAAGRAPDVTELGEGNLGGMTIARGVYKWGTGLLIPSDVTLSGTEADVWIFQIAQNLTMSPGARIVLTGGARPENVYWQVAGLVDLDTTSHCEGVILSATSITLRTGATVNGRLMAQTSVDLDGATVTEPTE